MKRKLLVMGLFTLILSGLFAQGQKVQNVVEYKLPHCGAIDSHFDMLAHKFVDSFEELSGGKFKGTVYPAEQLGKESQVIQNVQNGVIAFTVIGHDPLAQFVSDTALLSLPFLYADHAQAFKVLEGEVGDELENELATKNLHILGWSDNGARVYTNDIRPLEVPEDFKGLKLRSPPNPVNLAVTSALGGIPSAIAYGEVYTALQQKTIDGQENAVINIYPAKLQEVQKYMSITNHILSFVVLMVNEDFYNALSAEDKQTLDLATKVSMDWHRDYVENLTQELIDKMIVGGMKVNYPKDMKPFKEAAKVVHADYVGKSISQELYNKVLEQL